MSLAISTDDLIAVYALGQWYKVARGSFIIDSYELMEDCYGYVNSYNMGNIYEKRENEIYRADHYLSSDPTGMTGCSWVEEGTKVRVAMSLVEIKAFKYDALVLKEAKDNN